MEHQKRFSVSHQISNEHPGRVGVLGTRSKFATDFGRHQTETMVSTLGGGFIVSEGRVWMTMELLKSEGLKVAPGGMICTGIRLVLRRDSSRMAGSTTVRFFALPAAFMAATR